MPSVATEIFGNDTPTASSTTGTLAADPSTGGTTLTLTTGHGARFPTITSGVNQLRIRVDNEIMLVTAHGAAADTMTVTRAAEGTTAAAHSIGATVEVVITAEAIRRWMPDFMRQPRHNKLAAWTANADVVTTTCGQTAGEVYVRRMWTPEAITWSTVYYYVNTAATTPANTFIGVYSKAGTLLCKTADQSTALGTTGLKGPITLTAEAGQSMSAPGGPDEYVWITFLMGTGSALQLRSDASSSAMINVGLAASDIFIAGRVSTGASALPSSFTPTALSANITAWFGIV